MYLAAVHPDYQGRRRSAALLVRAERLLLMETLGLPTFVCTRACYRATGYVRAANMRDFFQAGQHKVVFSTAQAGVGQ